MPEIATYGLNAANDVLQLAGADTLRLSAEIAELDAEIRRHAKKYAAPQPPHTR